jgi:pimeloyl-ACP methyl ester carboxylesterase
MDFVKTNRKFSHNPAAFTESDIDEYVRWYSEVGAIHSALQYDRNRQTDSVENKESENRNLRCRFSLSAMGSSVEMMMQGIASDVRGSFIKNCGHWITEEQPEELTNQLLNFFGE